MDTFFDRDGMWNLISLWYVHSFGFSLSVFMFVLNEGIISLLRWSGRWWRGSVVWASIWSFEIEMDIFSIGMMCEFLFFCGMCTRLVFVCPYLCLFSDELLVLLMRWSGRWCRGSIVWVLIWSLNVEMNIFRDKDGMWNLISLWYVYSSGLCMSGFMSIFGWVISSVDGVEWEMVARWYCLGVDMECCCRNEYLSR